MRKTMLVCGLVFLAIPVLVTAKDFPLEFKTLNVEEVKGYQWSYGAVQMIVAAKPAALRKEPKPVSAHPLYGEFKWPMDKASMLFRIDESKGDGKGYDQLILDLNQNGDLADDPVISPTADVKPWSTFRGQEVGLFGPIEPPASKWNGPGKPIYYGILDLRTNAISKLGKGATATRNDYLGNLRLRAGYCLETTLEFDGRKQKVALIDNDANLRLGDLCRPRITGDGQWYLLAAEGDRLLLEKDGTNGRPQCFSQMLYLDTVPYKVALAADCGSLQVEPWPEPLAEVSLQPRGDQVRHLGLGWESLKDQWQFIEVGVARGKIKVPPGNYGLWAVSVSARTPPAGEVTASGGMNRKNVFSVAAGQANTLRCGAPLEINVTTERQGRSPASSGEGFWASLGNWFGNLASSESDELRIQAEVVGAGGETYSSFALTREHGLAQPAKPVFTIATADGKEVASGNLEYG